MRLRTKKHLLHFSPVEIRIWKQRKKRIRSAVKNGADLIELGIPFSDPTAEGPVIQEANLRA